MRTGIGLEGITDTLYWEWEQKYSNSYTTVWGYLLKTDIFLKVKQITFDSKMKHLNCKQIID